MLTSTLTTAVRAAALPADEWLGINKNVVLGVIVAILVVLLAWTSVVSQRSAGQKGDVKKAGNIAGASMLSLMPLVLALSIAVIVGLFIGATNTLSN